LFHIDLHDGIEFIFLIGLQIEGLGNIAMTDMGKSDRYFLVGRYFQQVKTIKICDSSGAIITNIYVINGNRIRIQNNALYRSILRKNRETRSKKK
jgi:hypothetical protein